MQAARRVRYHSAVSVLFRTGICDVCRWDAASARGQVREVSYRLLRCGLQGRVDIFEEVVRKLRHDSRIYRTTCRQRLRDVDALANSVLRRRFEANEPLVVHDWAASDCITSAEWARSLWQHFPLCRLIASDISFHLLEVTSRREAYVLEADGTPLQYICGPFVVSLRNNVSNRPVNRLLVIRASRRARGFAELVRSCRWSGLDDPAVFHFPPWKVGRLTLIHPEAAALRADCTAFQIETHSVFEPLGEPAGVIRTMNIFNPGYFAPNEVARGIGSVFNSLKVGGVWVTGRSTEQANAAVSNRVTILEKLPDRFAVLERMHGGWELEQMALKPVREIGAPPASV